MRHSLETEYGKYVKGGKYGKKLINTAIKIGANFNSKYVKN